MTLETQATPEATPHPSASEDETYLTAEELHHRIKYSVRTIRNNLMGRVLFEGTHWFRAFGGRKILFIWEAIKRDIKTKPAANQG